MVSPLYIWFMTPNVLWSTITLYCNNYSTKNNNCQCFINVIYNLFAFYSVYKIVSDDKYSEISIPLDSIYDFKSKFSLKRILASSVF